MRFSEFGNICFRCGLFIYILILPRFSFAQNTYSSETLSIPTLQAEGHLYSVSLRLVDFERSEFELVEAIQLQDRQSWVKVSYDNGVLSVPKIEVDSTLYNAVLSLSNSDPVKFVIRSVEEADQNMSLAKSMDLNYEFAVASENPWNYRLVSNLEFPSRSGSISELFELRPGDCNADCGRNYERAEVSETGNTRAVEGDELWYAWSFYVPEDYNDDRFQYGTSSWVNITQFHQSPNYDPAWIFSKIYGGDFVIRRFPTRWFTIPYREYMILPKEEYSGRWNDILVHVKWTTSANGFMKIWANNELVLDYKGFTRTPENNNVYFKYGLYRKAGPPSALNIYFDEVKRAASRDGVR